MIRHKLKLLLPVNFSTFTLIPDIFLHEISNPRTDPALIPVFYNGCKEILNNVIKERRDLTWFTNNVLATSTGRGEESFIDLEEYRLQNTARLSPKEFIYYSLDRCGKAQKIGPKQITARSPCWGVAVRGLTDSRHYLTNLHLDLNPLTNNRCTRCTIIMPDVPETPLPQILPSKGQSTTPNI